MRQPHDAISEKKIIMGGVARYIHYRRNIFSLSLSLTRGVYTMQALEQMLHEKSWGGKLFFTFLAYFYPKLGGSLF
jgi:hypothetical protein